MRYKILVLLTFALWSCKNDSPDVEGLLSEEQMIAVLIDIHILEGKIEKLNIPKDSGSMLFNTFEVEIFDKHQISKQEYIDSYEHYLEGVTKMNDIYTAVVDSLNYRQKSEDAKRKKESEEKTKKIKKSGLD